MLSKATVSSLESENCRLSTAVKSMYVILGWIVSVDTFVQLNTATNPLNNFRIRFPFVQILFLFSKLETLRKKRAKIGEQIEKRVPNSRSE